MGNSPGHWMPLYWSDYFGKTTHLSAEEHGVYLLLIGAYWQRGRPLPDDDKYLSTAARLSPKRWRFMRPKISEFFAVVNGVWTHERVDLEILKSCDRIAKASASAHARWHASDMLPTSTPTKEESNKVLLNGFIVGKRNGAGNSGTTIKDPNQRLAIFQKWLAEKPGHMGWMSVSAAADPSQPNHALELARCKAKAKELGKGWPHQWPAGESK